MPETEAADARGLARLLIERLAVEGHDEPTTVSVAELHRTLIPYPSCREALGFATKAEYDLAFLHLLEDPGLVSIAEEALTEAVREELESPEPGLGFLKNFAASPLSIRGPATSSRLDRASVESDPPPPDEPETGAEDEIRGETPAEETPARPSAGPDATATAWLETLEEPVRTGSGGSGPDAAASREESIGNGGTRDASARADEGARHTSTGDPGDARPSARCAACDGELPRREGVRYCPRCGADQRAARCRSCGEPLEPDWTYCPRCGGIAEGSRDDEASRP